MLFNRNPRFRYLNKINGFIMVILAGMVHRFGQVRHRISIQQLKSMAEKDSSFLPENIKTLFSQKKIEELKKISFYSEEEKDFFAKFKTLNADNAANLEEIERAKLAESYRKFRIINKIIDNNNEK